MVYWPGHHAMAMHLGSLAESSVDWPGLPPLDPAPLRVILAPDDATFDSVTSGRLPRWSVGAAFPASSTIVLKLRGDPRQTLRHELAHLALRRTVSHPPLWLDEGYASWASGEWGRLKGLTVNWAVLTGGAPALRDLERGLRAGPQAAETSYALATTAVILLNRLGGERGLGPLMSALRTHGEMDAALREVHLLSLDQFELLWRRDLKRRYGWLLLLSSLTVFWGLAAALLIALWSLRRRRDRARREALDEGWVIPDVLDGDGTSR